ncbi:MAG: hypothetical protein GJ680_07240 [Alteromonadaceae bacterium]|nr:hypothetical protein [Alteromonadaceae bacterium]
MKEQLRQIVVGLTIGVLITGSIMGTGLMLGSMQGWLVIIWPDESVLSQVWHWIYSNMKESIFAFLLVFLLWVYKIRTLRHQLKQGGDLKSISYSEHMVDVFAGVFFGIGVIFTAIGMRSALMESLGGLDAEAAAEQGAFVMLQKLVDGGILLALSTTIVGGIGGYLMRVFKSIYLGELLHAFYFEKQNQSETAVLEKLDAIERHLANVTRHQG